MDWFYLNKIMLNSIKNSLSNFDAKDVKRLCSDKVYRKGLTYFKEKRISKQ